MDWNKVKELIKKGNRFIGIYSGYSTGLSGETPIEAIKDFYSHYNAILTMFLDVKENKVYIAKENDEPDCRGNFNCSYFEKDTNDFIFNVDELTSPIKKIKPSKLNKNIFHAYIDRYGNIYECGFECHKYLAKELFLSNTLSKPNDYREYKAEEYLENMGWIKISSKKIIYYTNKNMSQYQKNKLIKWMDVIGDEQYEINSYLNTKYDIEIRLKENKY